MNALILGFKSFFKGHGYALKTKSLRRIIILSNFVNAAIFFVLVWLGLFPLMGFLQGALVFPDIWYFTVLTFIAKMFFAIIVFLASATFVYVISSFLLIGWGTVLAARTLQIKEGVRHRPLVIRVLSSIVKSLIVVFLSLFFYLMSFFPVIGIAGLFMVTLILTFDMMDYGFDEMGLTMTQRFSFFVDHILEAIGFSFALGIMMAIPFLNVIMLPGSIVAANYLLAEIKGQVEGSHS